MQIGVAKCLKIVSKQEHQNRWVAAAVLVPRLIHTVTSRLRSPLVPRTACSRDLAFCTTPAQRACPILSTTVLLCCGESPLLKLLPDGQSSEINNITCISLPFFRPPGSARYHGFSGHLRSGLANEGYPSGTDSNAKDSNRDGGKSHGRGGLPKHQDLSSSSKSDPKLASPGAGGSYPSPYSQAPGAHLGLPTSRGHPLLASESNSGSSSIPSRGGDGISSASSREKSQNKVMSIQEHELRALGKTTMTAANFINAIIMHQISCDAAMPETGALATNGTCDGKTLWDLWAVNATFPPLPSPPCPSCSLPIHPTPLHPSTLPLPLLCPCPIPTPLRLWPSARLWWLALIRINPVSIFFRFGYFLFFL